MSDEELDQRLRAQFQELGRRMRAGRLDEIKELLRAIRAQVESAGRPAPWLFGCLLVEGRLAAAAGRLGKAERAYAEALGLAESSFQADDPRTGQLLADLASLHATRQRWHDAEQCTLQAISLVRRGPPSCWEDLVKALLCLAECHLQHGTLTGAEQAIRQALELTERATGGNPFYQRLPLRLLGVLQYRKELYAEAEAIFRQQWRMERQADPVELSRLVQVHCDLAAVYRAQGRVQKMMRAVGRACRLARRARSVRSISLACCLDWLSTGLLTAGQAPRAERVARLAVKIKEKILGPQHTEVAQSLQQLGEAQAQLGQDLQAEQSFRRALAIGQHRLGPHAPDNMVCLVNLGLLARRAGHLEEAEQLFRQALALREETRGPTHPRSVAARQHLVELLRDLGRAEEADELACQQHSPTETDTTVDGNEDQAELTARLDEQMARAFQAFRGNDPGHAEPLLREAIVTAGRLETLDRRLGRALVMLAIVRDKQGDREEGERLARRALVVLQQAVGPEDLDVAAAQQCLGTMLLDQQRYVEAEAPLRQAWTIRQRFPDRDQAGTFQLAWRLLDLLEQLGRPEEALEHGRRALALGERVRGVDHVQVGYLCYRQAVVSVRLGQVTEAAVLARRAVRVAQVAPESATFFSPRLLAELAQLCQQLGEGEAAAQARQCCGREL
jgi:tetratricopeptide (TPR) repeat protein